MSLLTRYLIRQNLFLVFTVLLVGTGLYILSDLFERMDDFIDAGLGLSGMLVYFAVKTPSIVSQILPAVFLLALVVQLNILERSRELVALQAGGISYLVLVRFVVIYGLVWSMGQLFFSQVVGVEGDRMATRIWQEDVRGKDATLRNSISGLWFTEGSRIFHIGKAYPDLKKGLNLLSYNIDSSGIGISEIIQASSFTIEKRQWVLQNATRLTPGAFTKEHLDLLELPIRQDLKAFQVTEASSSAAQLPLWELSSVITRLQKAGSNVEGLRTTWHGKLAYAFSIAVMGMLGLMLSQLSDNIYKSVGLALLCVFFFHAMNTFCVSMGEKGITSPAVGAWFANTMGFLVTCAWFAWPKIRQRLHMR